MRSGTLLIFLVLTLCCCFLRCAHATTASTSTSLQSQCDAMQALFARTFAERFHFEVIFRPLLVDDDGEPQMLEDRYVTARVGDTVTIKGTSASAMGVALRRLAADQCGLGLHWDVDAQRMLSGSARCSLQQIPPNLQVASGTRFRHRYHMNAVTYGYSSQFWSLDRWYREVDWAVLRGVNLMLAHGGVESLYDKIWRTLGLSEADATEYLPSPVFFCWHRMANLDGAFGPPPRGYIQRQAELHDKVRIRMESLGITPALPHFSGHVPCSLKKVIPDLKVTKTRGWCGFQPTCILDPTEPHFEIISNHLNRLLANSTFYQVDTWNEQQPPSWTREYLRSSAAAVAASIPSSSKWLMQGWTFLFGRSWGPTRVADYLSGVPDDRLVVLDLFAESEELGARFPAIFKKVPYIWCSLINFGGTHGLYGKAERQRLGPWEARGNIQGVGFSMEAVHRNAMLFELLADTAWQPSEPIQIPVFLKRWTRSRYGFEAVKPWTILYNSVYQWEGQLTWSAVVTNPNAIYNGQQIRLPKYDERELVRAWTLFLDAAPKHPSPAFLHDVVDTGRQVLVNAFSHAVSVWNAPLALDILQDLDMLLNSNENFRLCALVREVENAGRSAEEKTQLRRAFLNQITLWGMPSQHQILNDYAAKEMSPMILRYYHKRWQLRFKEEASTNFQRTFWATNDDLCKTADPAATKGNTLDISHQLHRKYSDYFERKQGDRETQRGSDSGDTAVEEDTEEEENTSNNLLIYCLLILAIAGTLWRRAVREKTRRL